MTTKAGTWAPTQEEADRIEAIVDRDERWEQSLAGKEEFINRPLQPPGLLRSGTRPHLAPHVKRGPSPSRDSHPAFGAVPETPAASTALVMLRPPCRTLELGDDQLAKVAGFCS